jgi:hypothetical protein
MRQKFEIHHNARFDITNTDTSLFVSFTTTPYKPFEYFLWSLCNGGDQYIHYNNVCIIKNNLVRNILEISNKKKDCIGSLELHNRLINFNKLNEIELYLTSAYTQFERCIQHTQDFRKCNTMLIEYSTQAEIVLYLCQNIFIGF